MVVIFPLNSKGKKISSDYNVGYSFSLTENQFQIEFYDKDNKRLDSSIPHHLIDKFKALDANLKNYRFYRRCDSCQRYHYSSGVFRFNLETCSLRFRDGFFVSSEYFGLIQAMQKGSKTPYRIYRLLNVYVPDASGEVSRHGSHLTYWNSADPHGTLSDRTTPNEATYLDLPLIPFISPEDTLSRIQKLLVFS